MILPRTIFKQDLARIIYPDSSTVVSAMQRLRREIQKNKNLKDKLYPQGASLQMHHFTRNQIQVLVEYYDLTQEELNKYIHE